MHRQKSPLYGGFSAIRATRKTVKTSGRPHGFPQLRIDWQKNHIKSGCSAVGSARSLGLRCRRFKSDHSDQRLRDGCPGGVFLPISLFTAAQILTVYDAGFPLSGGSFPRRSPPSSVRSARTIFPRIPLVFWRRRFLRSACRRRLWANIIHLFDCKL